MRHASGTLSPDRVVRSVFQGERAPWRFGAGSARKEEYYESINVNKAPVVLGGPVTVTLPKPVWPVVDERDVERVARQAYYAMIFHFDPARAEGLTRDQYRQALEAEGIHFNTTLPLLCGLSRMALNRMALLLGPV
jgi:hypothetical protein